MNEQIAIYQTVDSNVKIDVKTDSDTVWLNRRQISELFGRDLKTIGKHINNALREELSGLVVGAIQGKTQTHRVEHYNLDMILSVGYRVKSKEGIYFRRWANEVLKKHLIQGYSLNQAKLDQLNKTIDIISRSENPELSGVTDVLKRFTNGLMLLDDYDHQSLVKPNGSDTTFILKYEEIMCLLVMNTLAEQ